MNAGNSIVAVVDDEEAVCRAMRRLLTSAGYTVSVFTDGNELLKSIPTNRPDCVVLDLHMTGMDGFTVQEKLATTGANVPVIVITGHDSADAQQRALAGGAAAYLRKPVDGKLLLDAIASVLPQDDC